LGEPDPVGVEEGVDPAQAVSERGWIVEGEGERGHPTGEGIRAVRVIREVKHLVTAFEQAHGDVASGEAEGAGDGMTGHRDCPPCGVGD